MIASSVIGGADLMGGAGGAYGAFVGAALIEIIRNSLTLLGISTFWRGTFVGSFIIGFLFNFGQAMFPDLAYVILFLPMLLVLIFRPQGLIGEKGRDV